MLEEHVTETCRASIAGGTEGVEKKAKKWPSTRKRDSGVEWIVGRLKPHQTVAMEGFTRHNNERHGRECPGRVYLNTIRVSRAELLLLLSSHPSSSPSSFHTDLPSLLPRPLPRPPPECVVVARARLWMSRVLKLSAGDLLTRSELLSRWNYLGDSFFYKISFLIRNLNEYLSDVIRYS